MKEKELSDYEKTMTKKIEMLTSSLEKVYPSTRMLMWRSFIQGIFVALGTTIGLSIVLAIVTYLITTLKFIPGVNQIIDKTHIEQVLPEENE